MIIASGIECAFILCTLSHLRVVFFSLPLFFFFFRKKREILIRSKLNNFHIRLSAVELFATAEIPEGAIAGGRKCVYSG